MNRSYKDTHAFSISNPEEFWAAQAEKLHWFRKWDRVLDESKAPFFRWFSGGLTNLCYNAVDRHALGAGRNRVALIWESPETGRSRVISFFELYRLVNRFALVLKKHGVKKGERVIIYMPMTPEAVVAVLACARIGAVHSVVFGGFSTEALADRINDSKACMLVCADAGVRKGKVVPLKKIVDEAVEAATHKISKVLVLDRSLTEWNHFAGRDLKWAEEMESVSSATVEPEKMSSDDPSYILYTSGTTGKPKGIVRDSGGYMTALHASMEMVYGCGPEDVFWSTSDIGWVVGHSYIIYGPLLYGIPTLIFEGTPDSPTPSIWWEIIEKYGVTVVFSAPTAMRILRKFPEHWMQKADISSLRHVFLAGEPLDEATYHWAASALRKPVIDHYWQTESGWPMLTNHMGLETLPIKAGSPTKAAMGWNMEVVREDASPTEPGERGVLVAFPPLPPGALLTVWGNDEAYINTYWSSFGGKTLYYSGDYAIRDADGYFFLLGRADEVINVAGHRMGTREVEEVISDHPQVAECSAIGIADELKGQAIAAFVVLKQGVRPDDDVKKSIADLIRKRIGAIAVPQTLQIVAQLPKTRSGKVMRRVLRAICEKRDMGDLSTIEDGAGVEEIRRALEAMQGKI